MSDALTARYAKSPSSKKTILPWSAAHIERSERKLKLAKAADKSRRHSA